MRTPKTLVLYACAALALSSTGTAAPLFTGIGDLPGGDFLSGANNVSGDGSVVVGNARNAVGTQPELTVESEEARRRKLTG